MPETTNKNFLSPSNFKLMIANSPNVQYFADSVELPDITLGQIDLLTPLVKFPVPGDKLTYGTMSVSFKVDEDMTNYLEIFNWLIRIGFPEDYTQYNANNIYSDGTLFILNNAFNSNKKVFFTDIYPISLSGITFDAKTDAVVAECTVTFAFTKMRFDNN